MKMLIADDDRDLRELIGFTLTQAGYLVVKAADGQTALRVFESESPGSRRARYQHARRQRLSGVRGDPRANRACPSSCSPYAARKRTWCARSSWVPTTI